MNENEFVITEKHVLLEAEKHFTTNHIRPEIIAALAWAESLNNEFALSKAGAMGLLQLTPIVLLDLANRFQTKIAPYNWKENISGAMIYLDWIFTEIEKLYISGEKRTLQFAIAAWNWGFTNAKNLWKRLQDSEESLENFIFYTPTETRQLFKRFYDKLKELISKK